MNRLGRLAFVAVLTSSVTACLGRVTLAPHLNRERELAPDTVAGRHSAVLDRAAAFEKQNEKSRDLHWYRAWRAAAMVGLEQYEEALALLAEVQGDMTTAKSPPAQSDRLRMFIYDLEARALLATGRPADALGRLERALPISRDVSLETDGECDRELMLGARSKQLERVAQAAGEPDRATKANGEAARHLDRWARCVAAIDYPGMSPTLALAEALTTGPSPVVAPPPPPTAPPAVAPPPPPVRSAPPPPPPPPAPAARPGATPLAALAPTDGRYAPVSKSNHEAAIAAVRPLLVAPLDDASAGIVIRTDGRHHALSLTTTKRVADAESLAPSFKALIVFFEKTRAVKPNVDHVLVEANGERVLASRQDVFDLFLERIDVPTFVTRLRRVR